MPKLLKSDNLASWPGSPALKIGQYIFCSGIRPAMSAGEENAADFRTNVARTLENMKKVLAQGNATLDHVYQTHVFVKDMGMRPIVNEVLREYYQREDYPTRVIAEVSNLIDDSDIEIVCNAYIPQDGEEVRYLYTTQGHIPTGPFSQGARIGNVIYCSGVRPIDPQTQKLVQGDFRARVRQCFENLKAILTQGNATMDDVYSTIVYLKNMADRPIVNEVTREYFKDGKFPLRVIIEIERLNEDHDIEIECNAYLGEKTYILSTEGIPPLGPYSQGVKVPPFIHCSGVLPLNPKTQEVVEGDFAARVRQCLENLRAVLKAGGADLAHVYSTTVYLRDIKQLPVVDQVYAEYFSPGNYPVRYVVEISNLYGDYDVEIACSAYVGD